MRERFEDERAPLVRDINSYAKVFYDNIVHVPDAAASTPRGDRPPLGSFNRKKPAPSQDEENPTAVLPPYQGIPGIINRER